MVVSEREFIREAVRLRGAAPQAEQPGRKEISCGQALCWPLYLRDVVVLLVML